MSGKQWGQIKTLCEGSQVKNLIMPSASLPFLPFTLSNVYCEILLTWVWQKLPY